MVINLGVTSYSKLHFHSGSLPVSPPFRPRLPSTLAADLLTCNCPCKEGQYHVSQKVNTRSRKEDVAGTAIVEVDVVCKSKVYGKPNHPSVVQTSHRRGVVEPPRPFPCTELRHARHTNRLDHLAAKLGGAWQVTFRHHGLLPPKGLGIHQTGAAPELSFLNCKTALPCVMRSFRKAESVLVRANAENCTTAIRLERTCFATLRSRLASPSPTMFFDHAHRRSH